MSTLEIRNLQVSVDTDNGTVDILKGVDLTINSGETHAIMGPNGSGKSTLAYSIAGHPKYTITGGTVTLDGVDVLEMSVDERAKQVFSLRCSIQLRYQVFLYLTSFVPLQQHFVARLQSFVPGWARLRMQWKP
jgi:Fe-S cluster assembly ATPase SufC